MLVGEGAASSFIPWLAGLSISAGVLLMAYWAKRDQGKEHSYLAENGVGEPWLAICRWFEMMAPYFYVFAAGAIVGITIGKAI